MGVGLGVAQFEVEVTRFKVPADTTIRGRGIAAGTVVDNHASIRTHNTCISRDEGKYSQRLNRTMEIGKPETSIVAS